MTSSLRSREFFCLTSQTGSSWFLQAFETINWKRFNMGHAGHVTGLIHDFRAGSTEKYGEFPHLLSQRPTFVIWLHGVASQTAPCTQFWLPYLSLTMGKRPSSCFRTSQYFIYGDYSATVISICIRLLLKFRFLESSLRQHFMYHVTRTQSSLFICFLFV
jgi:hypothetical protein